MITLLRHFVTQIRAQIYALSWSVLAPLTAAHLLISWAALAWLADEPALTAPSVFWYFYVTTATTVGYGDFSPETTAGRAVTALWVMPGGIALFTAVLGKLIELFASHWRREMEGKSDYSKLDDALVIIGWRGDRTLAMIDQIEADARFHPEHVVLLATAPEHNPDPDSVRFVRARDISSEHDLRRAGVARARQVVVYGASDGETLAAALAVAALNPRAHLVAHFESQATAELLKAHHPRAECVLALAVEMLVRAVQDPGSSQVARTMSSNLMGATQFSLTVPDAAPEGLVFGDAFGALKRRHGMTCVGLAPDGPEDDDVLLNPPLDHPLKAGDALYYLAEQRVLADEIDWADLRR